MNATDRANLTMLMEVSERKERADQCVQWNSTILGVFPFVLILMVTVTNYLRTYWLQPRMIRKIMESQGVVGPLPRFLMGNLAEMTRMREEETSRDMVCVKHDIVNRLLPHYVRWSRLYGKRFIFWWGIEPRMTVTEPDLIKEILSSQHSLRYGKSYLQQKGVCDFIGKGLIMANGDAWAHQRRVVTPAFNLERLKKQLPHIVDLSQEMMNRWDKIMNEGAGREPAEIDVSKDLSLLAGDIIARTIFGSSYQKGRRIFDQLTSLQKLSSRAGRYQWLPISRFLLISVNSKIRGFKREVENSLKDIIQGRLDHYNDNQDGSRSYGDDLLGLMLFETEKPCADNLQGQRFRFTTQQLLDECKTFLFAGHDTTALHLAWTMMLLAANPSWQEKARKEVFNTCGTNAPDADSLPKLKILGMILNESLRLYTPASLLSRQAFTDMQIGELLIPRGLSIWIPTLAIHHDKELWGADADEFKPQRFADGASKACKHPMGFLPFSYGPRSCVGQTLATMETKVVLALILTRFTFRLSPNYKHAPVFVLTLKPKHGIQLILENIKQ